MVVYQQSTLPFSSARSYVAAAGGSEGDPTMEILSGRAVSAALERFTNYWRWEHYFTVFSGYQTSAGMLLPPVSMSLVVPPNAGDSGLSFTPTGVNAYSAIANRPSTYGGGYVLDFNDDPRVRGYGWVALNDGVGVLSLNGSLPWGSALTSVTFHMQGVPLPSDVREIYDVRLLRSGRVLQMIDQRSYDIARFQDLPGTTTHYGIFNAKNNVSATLTLFPPPNEADQVFIRYYRRPAMPSASGVVLDIPQDAEHAVISLGKAYYLADRGGQDARGDKWRSEGEAALKELRAKENQKPEEFAGFRPGYEAKGMRVYPNETWPYLVEG